MRLKNLFLVVLLFFSIQVRAQKNNRNIVSTASLSGTVWSAERANTWYSHHKWICGSNFLPSTAVNQLEMWQAETFDPITIDRELGWAENIGMNTMRVFLHSLAWKVDHEGFKRRVDQFLSMADKHHIQPLFVFFDDCWNKIPH